MQKAQHPVDSVSSRNLGSYLYQLLSLMGFMVLLLVSSSAFAEKPNPGMEMCPAGTEKYALSDNDYTQLSSSATGTTHVLDNQKMAINIGITDSAGSSVTEPSKISKRDGYINVDRWPTGDNRNREPDFTDIKLKFFMPNTTAALAVKKLGVTIFDLDGGSSWSDIVRITGTTTGSGTIEGEYHPVDPTSVQYLSPGHSVATYGGYTIYPKTRSCTANDATCQASFVFDEEVTSVNVNFGNTQNLDRQGRSSIRIKLDSYCYTPPFSISKDDGRETVSTGSTTDYSIKVTNTGNNTLSGLLLKDPAVTGLSKLSGISCDTSVSNNACTISTLPTVAQLQGSGFTVPNLAAGRNYSIKVPAQVTAAAGSSVTNTATVSLGLESTSASDKNNVTSSPFSGGGNAAAPSCPSGDTMYYLGSKNVTHTPLQKKPLSWSGGTGNASTTYTFADGVQFRLSFSDTAYLLTGYPSYSSYSGVTNNAINMFHDSQRAAINHRLQGTVINRPVTKYGFVVQDLDSSQGRKYIESLSLVTPGGVFSNLRANHFKLSNFDQMVSGDNWNNCSTSNACDFNVNWSPTPGNTTFAANIPFTVTHGNPYTGASTTTSAGEHLMGYSDFYFCVAPTTSKLTVIKQLDGERDDKKDQFKVTVTDSSASEVGSFITEGEKAQVTSGTDRVSNITVNKDMSYTITEQVVEMDKGTIKKIRDIKKYDATYQCVANSPSTIVASGALNYNESGGSNSRSFTLSSTAITKDLVCTITNKKSKDVGYTFEGTIFNDNGGLSASSTTHMANDYYFNGEYEPGVGESGINIINSGVQVRLYDCANGKDITEDSDKNGPKGNKVITPVYDSLYPGHYIFTVPSNGIKEINNVCIAQIEPASGWDYVDTTPDLITISGVKDNRDTIFSYANNNFGEVEVANTALVLKKQQYVHDCSPFDYATIDDNTTDPSVGFSTKAADVDPGQCIAYKITATNRGNIDLNDIVISDTLQKEGVNGATVTSTLANAVNTADGFATNRAIGYNGTITTQPFNLNNKAERSFYFNTQYGE